MICEEVGSESTLVSRRCWACCNDKCVVSRCRCPGHERSSPQIFNNVDHSAARWLETYICVSKAASLSPRVVQQGDQVDRTAEGWVLHILVHFKLGTCMIAQSMSGWTPTISLLEALVCNGKMCLSSSSIFMASSATVLPRVQLDIIFEYFQMLNCPTQCLRHATTPALSTRGARSRLGMISCCGVNSIYNLEDHSNMYQPQHISTTFEFSLSLSETSVKAAHNSSIWKDDWLHDLPSDDRHNFCILNHTALQKIVSTWTQERW